MTAPAMPIAATTTSGTLSIAAPTGWAISQMQLAQPDGSAHLNLAPAWFGAESSVEKIAEQLGRELAEGLPGYAEQSLDRGAGPGGELIVRRFSWQVDEQPQRNQAQFYRVEEGGRGWVVTLTTRDPASDEQVEHVARLVAGASVVPPMPAREYSVEELSALAEFAGRTSFPGTGEHSLGSAPERLAAHRALVARGTLREVDDGRLLLEAFDHRLVATALNPTAIVNVEHRHGGADEHWLMYAAPALSVLQSSSAQAVHRLEPVLTQLATPTIAGCTRLVDRPAAGDGELTLPLADFRRLRAAAESGQLDPESEKDQAKQVAGILDSVVGSSRVQVVPAADADLTENELTWLDAGERGLWTVAAEDDLVTLGATTAEQIGQRLEALCAPLSPAAPGAAAPEGGS